MAGVLVLSRYFKKHFQEDRVGVVLPSCALSFIVIPALLHAGKTPVLLNFTSSLESILDAQKKAEVKTLLTVGHFKGKLKDFPWTNNTIDLFQVLKSLHGEMIFYSVLCALLPRFILKNWNGFQEKGNSREAVILFSSGSEGSPKAIPLTHRNIQANFYQVQQIRLLEREQTILANLPLFHSFGYTVNLWLPLLNGNKIICYPNPLDLNQNAKIIEEEKVSVLAGTPTFLKRYLNKKERFDKKLRSLDFVIAGAEKSHPQFKLNWEESFGSRYLEGYGMTECSPVVSIQLPDSEGHFSSQNAVLKESAGKLLPGIQAKIVHALSGKELQAGESGCLYLRGPNVFKSYLKDRNPGKDLFEKDWFRTNDIARIDEAGHLYLDGRLSRFSKIAGEMVPHLKVESEILALLGSSLDPESYVTVLGVEDFQKGEALCLLSNLQLNLEEIARKLRERNIPNLWIPKKQFYLKEIPRLGSGKLDWVKIQKLVRSF